MARTRALRRAATAAGLVALVLTGCGSSDDSGSPSSPATDRSVALVGGWVADAGTILEETMVNLGLPDGLTCSGPVTTTFAPEGTFTRTGAVACTTGAQSVSGNIDTSGRWVADAGTLTIIADAPRGTMDVGGSMVPTPDGFGTGVARYRIDGDTLEVTFTSESVGDVTQTYTRSG